MDQTQLLSVLAKKYDVDITEDWQVMNLFNRLCRSVEIQDQTIEYNDQLDIIRKDFNKAQYDRVAYHNLIISLLFGEDLSQIVKTKVKNIVTEQGITVDYNKNNEPFLKTTL